MRRATGRRAPANSGRLVLVATAVVALVAVDVALVAVALARNEPVSNVPAGPVPTFTSTRSPSSGTTSTPGPAGTARATSATPRYLEPLDGQTAWRATSGTCGGEPGVLERTSDAGHDWTVVGLAGRGGSIVGLRADDEGVSVALRSGTDCVLGVRRSTDDGQTWRDADDGAAGAVVDGRALLLSPGRTVSPCGQAVAVYEGSETTTVVCGDGTVRWRRGTGAWVTVQAVGVRALADAGSSYVLARTSVPGCDGVRVDSLPAVDVRPTTTPTRLGCVDQGSAQSGPEAIGWADGTAWIWTGDHVRLSTDGGSTW